MYVTIGMILLNEAECIERNLRQHYEFADKIIIVEGADPLYPRHRVTDEGLSTDATAEIIRGFPDPDGKIRFIQHGFTHRNGSQAKCELRNRYAEETPDGLLCVIDADEAYIKDDLRQIIAEAADEHFWAWEYPWCHFWKTPEHFITGGYYSIGHTRFWRWRQGMRYAANHNFPEFPDGTFVHQWGKRSYRRVLTSDSTGCHILGRVGYHFGFAKRAENVRDKTDYYRNRGECQTRPKTIESREAWFDEALPDGHKVWPFNGELPEEFRDWRAA